MLKISGRLGIESHCPHVWACTIKMKQRYGKHASESDGPEWLFPAPRCEPRECTPQAPLPDASLRHSCSQLQEGRLTSSWAPQDLSLLSRPPPPPAPPLGSFVQCFRFVHPGPLQGEGLGVPLAAPDLPHHQRAPWVILSSECSSYSTGEGSKEAVGGAAPATRWTTYCPAHTRWRREGCVWCLQAEPSPRQMQEGGWRAPSQGSPSRDHYGVGGARKNSTLNMVSVKIDPLPCELEGVGVFSFISRREPLSRSCGSS